MHPQSTHTIAWCGTARGVKPPQINWGRLFYCCGIIGTYQYQRVSIIWGGFDCVDCFVQCNLQTVLARGVKHLQINWSKIFHCCGIIGTYQYQSVNIIWGGFDCVDILYKCNLQTAPMLASGVKSLQINRTWLIYCEISWACNTCMWRKWHN